MRTGKRINGLVFAVFVAVSAGLLVTHTANANAPVKGIYPSSSSNTVSITESSDYTYSDGSTGQGFTLSWSSGNVARPACTLTKTVNGGDSVSVSCYDGSSNGSCTPTPAVYGTHVFTFQCNGFSASVSHTVAPYPHPSCVWHGPVDGNGGAPDNGINYGDNTTYPQLQSGAYANLVLSMDGPALECRENWSGLGVGGWTIVGQTVTQRIGPLVASCTDPAWCSPPPAGRFTRSYECHYRNDYYVSTNTCTISPEVAPTVNIYWSSSSVTSGATSNIHWSTSNADYCEHVDPTLGINVGVRNVNGNGLWFNNEPGGWGYGNRTTNGETWTMRCWNGLTGPVTAQAVLTVTPPPDNAPVGSLDSVTSGVVGSCGVAGGWAFDPDKPSQSIEVHLYDPTGYNTGATSGDRPDVNSAFGITGNHGFTYQLPEGNTPGTYTVRAYPIGINSAGAQNGNNPEMGGSPKTFICTPAPVNNASCTSMSAPLSVITGASFSASVVMNNNGTKTWSPGANYNLGSQPQDNTIWGFGRVGLPVSSVAPGASATFNFTGTAPSTPGTYSFGWKMVQDGVEWFGTSCSQNITVTAPNGSCAATHYSCGANNTSSANTDSAASWTWNCTGANGGSTVSCSENKPPACAAAHYNCAVGTSAGGVKNGPTWTWSCSNGGITVSCSQTGAAATGDIVPNTCTIPSGQSSCAMNVGWTSANTNGTVTVKRVYDNNSIFATGTSGNQSATFTPPGTYRMNLYDDNTLLDFADFTSSCVSGTTWDGSKCAAPVPTCSSASASPSSTGATTGFLPVSAYGVSSSVTAVYFPTWGDTGGQDDLVWYPGTKNGSTWTAQVNLGNHKSGNPEYGNFNVHVYMTDPNFTNVWCGTANFSRNQPATPSGALTLTPSTSPNCTVAQNASTCTIAASWSTAYATGAYLWDRNVSSTLYTANSSVYPPGSTVYVWGGPGGTTFDLKNGDGTIFDTKVATTVCASGSSWNNSSGKCTGNVVSCTGLPASANGYPAPDNTGLGANTPYTFSASDTAAKCEFSCASGYSWSGGNCVANAGPSPSLTCSRSPDGSPLTAPANLTFTATPANGAAAPYTFKDGLGTTLQSGNNTTYQATYSTEGNYSVTVSASNVASVSCLDSGGSANFTIRAAGCSGTAATIIATPARVTTGTISNISWTATGVRTSCVISGTDGYNNTVAAGAGCTFPSGSVNRTINAQTTYCITCDGDASSKKCVTVNILPAFQEF